jgi:hypothetical protein
MGLGRCGGGASRGVGVGAWLQIGEYGSCFILRYLSFSFLVCLQKYKEQKKVLIFPIISIIFET